MSANTRQETLARLATLAASAIDLINKNGRKWYETEALFDALQGYKDGTLGWVEPIFSPVEHRLMFCAAIRGSRCEYERLLDSLREFGVNQMTILKLKSCKAKTLLELWCFPLERLDDFPYESVISNAFRQVQKKIGIEKPVGFPVFNSDHKELQKLVEEVCGVSPQK